MEHIYGLEEILNLSDINWEKETVNEYATNGTQCNQLLTITKDTFLDQVVQEPTRVTETTANVLDLFFTNNSTLTNKVEVIPGISDHEAVFIESSLRPLKVKVPPRKVFMYKDIDYNPMKDELRKFYGQYQESSKGKNVEQLWTEFKDKIHSLMNEHIPTKLIRGNKNKKPWISKEVKSLIRKRNKQYKKYKKTKDKMDLKRYKETKAHLQKAERQSYWKYINNIIEIGDPDQEDRPPKQK